MPKNTAIHSVNFHPLTETDNPRPIIYYLSSIIYYLSSIIYYLLSIIYYLLSIIYYLTSNFSNFPNFPNFFRCTFASAPKLFADY